MKKQKATRIEREKRIVERMIRLYCRRHEGNRQLCPACSELLAYAHARLGRCPFGERKTSCRQCTIHCYKPSMSERMKRVMRFSGPRMLFYAPIETIRHLLGR